MVNVGWFATQDPILLGHGCRLGESRIQPVCLSMDHALRGFLDQGGTGSGKSVMMDNVSYSHVCAGRGFTQFDMDDLNKTTLARICELAIPGRLTQDKIDALGDKLLVIDLSNQEYGVPGYNFLAPHIGRRPFELIDALVELLREIWPDAMGARLLDISRHALLCLSDAGLTIAEMVLFLSDAQVRHYLVHRCRNEDVKTFFQGHLAGIRESDQRIWFESSRNKWSTFVSSPFIRPFIGQTRSTFNWRDVIDSGKIVLVVLNRAHLMRESRAALGVMMLCSILSAALSRENISRDQRIFHALMIDELQALYCSVIDDFVETCRKFGIANFYAHQSNFQEPFASRRGAIATLLSNCHTKVAYSVARQDAERLAAEFFTPSGQHIKYQETSLLGFPMERPQYYSLGEEMQHYVAALMHQRPGQAIISFKGLCDDHRPYLVRTPLLPACDPHPEKLDALLRHVGQRYFRPLNVVNREIDQRWIVLRQRAAAQHPRPNHQHFNR